MKIRNGHVSNSSSSSFVLIGRCLNSYGLHCYDNKKDIWYIGDYLAEGRNIIKLDNDDIEKIIQNMEDFEHEKIIESSMMIEIDDEESILEFDKESFPGEKFHIYVFEKDFHCTSFEDVFNKITGK